MESLNQKQNKKVCYLEVEISNRFSAKFELTSNFLNCEGKKQTIIALLSKEFDSFSKSFSKKEKKRKTEKEAFPRTQNKQEQFLNQKTKF